MTDASPSAKQEPYRPYKFGDGTIAKTILAVGATAASFALISHQSGSALVEVAQIAGAAVMLATTQVLGGNSVSKVIDRATQMNEDAWDEFTRSCGGKILDKLANGNFLHRSIVLLPAVLVGIATSQALVNEGYTAQNALTAAIGATPTLVAMNVLSRLKRMKERQMDGDEGEPLPERKSPRMR